MDDVTLFTIAIGVGATAVIDGWALLRRSAFGIALPNYALVGRWLGHAMRGRLLHASIAKSTPIARERLLGWCAHYAIGIAFAALLIAIEGRAWIARPTLAPALAVGVATVLAPFLVLQPGMGAGIFARRTPNPTAARLQSLVTHAVFGLGLFAAGCAAQSFVTSY